MMQKSVAYEENYSDTCNHANMVVSFECSNHYMAAVIKNRRKSLAVSYKRRIFAEKRDKMTQLNRKLPLGIQDFEEMRRDHYIYADKTDMVWKLANGTKYNYLSRPRRFGKSLLLTTMKSYFEGKKELFKGLVIEKLEKDWISYPVLHFDMSMGKHMEIAQLERYFDQQLAEQEQKWGITNPAVDANVRLISLIQTAYRETGKQVVILIDEYDAPLLDVVHEDEKLEELRNAMRNFYSPLKGCEKLLRFVFLTGITKFSQLSIFSELNNITNISMDEPYAGICGITEDELVNGMRDDIDALAEKLNLSYEQTLAKLKDNYDGYHFTWPSPDVYNPFSLLTCFAKQKIDSYWFGSGTPTYLINMMRNFNFLPANLGESMEAGKDDFDAATETMTTIMPLLYQSGYITIKDYDEETELYTLAIPNKEIRVGLYRSLLPHYLTSKTAMCNTTIAKMSVLIKQRKIDEALQLLKSFWETVPYCNNTHYEGHYQQTMYIIFALLTNFRIIVEQHTSKGRIDITMETDDTIYVMELKFGKTAQEALEQIESKHYADAFAMSGKEIIKVGMSFNIKEDNTIVFDWKSSEN